jgi:hypothetical protein
MHRSKTSLMAHSAVALTPYCCYMAALWTAGVALIVYYERMFDLPE